MQVKIFNFKENKEIGTINVRKNSSDKIILKNIIDFIIQKYHCGIKNYLIAGNIDYTTNTRNLHYILFGENLPFREFSFEIMEENK